MKYFLSIGSINNSTFSNIFDKILGTVLFFAAASALVVSCSRKIHHDTFCSDPLNACQKDTVSVSLAASNSIPVCPEKTVINMTNVEVLQSKIKFGDSVQFNCIGQSPSACFTNKIDVVKSLGKNFVDIQVLFEIDTCNANCKQTIAAAELIPIPFTYSWTPKTRGEFTINFINIYGGDFQQKIIVD